MTFMNILKKIGFPFVKCGKQNIVKTYLILILTPAIIVNDLKAEEMNLNISLKKKIYNDDDSILLKKFDSQLTNKVNELLRKQNDETKLKNYFIEEIENNKWGVGQKDEENNRFITNNKYNSIKPILDILAARIIQSGTIEFKEHLDFLNLNADLITLNKHKEFYNYANSLKHNYSKHVDLVIEQEIFVNLSDDVQKQVTAKQANLDNIEEIQESNVIKFNQEQEADMILFQNENENVSKLELESEPKEEQAYLLLKQKKILNYSPVINPRGRPHGRASLVAYKQKDDKNNQDKRNKRAYKQTSSDLNSYQQQIRGNVCGLFALAFATPLCYKDVPSLMFYDQLSLRDHYVKRIENNEIQAFPSKSKRGSTRNVFKLVDLYLN
ncbi:unnamed protein product [Rotaria socialis]|uniref:Uncharacterized protein n=1 Tax=Rotaria socialis TaxID=392032 RepID=A0A818D6N0_9BILA|nr:unnamed protein product [Rotaria socialis]CAF3442778.1 unnamed protein product [Rotaria socialis]